MALRGQLRTLESPPSDPVRLMNVAPLFASSLGGGTVAVTLDRRTQRALRCRFGSVGYTQAFYVDNTTEISQNCVVF